MHGSIVMRLGGVAVALAAIALLLAAGQPAYAVDITVNTTADELNANGNCSLREAITAANTDAASDACPAGSGADVITLPAGTYPMAPGTSEDGNADGDYDIRSDLTINGAGAATTIMDNAGAPGERHFDIDTNNGPVTVEISGITMQEADEDSDGGSIVNQSSGTLTLNSVVITNNENDSDAGGIENDGTLTINDSTISNNSASTSDNGGAIRNNGTLTINRSTLNNNFGGFDGGGIANSGEAAINNTTITGNTVNDGGIGGGISVFGPTTINNSTIAGNSASGGGGGISDDTELVTAQLFVSAGAPPVDVGASVSLGGKSSPSIDITNSIVANNTTGGDCDVTTLTSGGNNLDSDSTCDLTGTGDKPGQDPQLAALAANGGPPQTMAIPAGSPATDAGNNATCLPTDQRGIARPQDGNSDANAVCDMGAYELQVPATPAPGTPTLAPATEAPVALPPTGDGSGDGGGVSPIWLVLGAIAALVAATAGLRVARSRG